MPVRLLASFVIFVAVMNTGIVVVLLSLGVVCAVLGLLLLSLRRDNARLSDERAAADEARRLAEESRRVSEEKAAAAEIEIRTLVERSTLAQARLEAAEQRMAEARAEREKWRKLSGPSSRTSPMTFWANSRALSRRPTAKRSTCC